MPQLSFKKVKELTILFSDKSRRKYESVMVDVFENYIDVGYLNNSTFTHIIPFTHVVDIKVEVEQCLIK